MNEAVRSQFQGRCQGLLQLRQPLGDRFGAAAVGREGAQFVHHAMGVYEEGVHV